MVNCIVTSVKKSEFLVEKFSNRSHYKERCRCQLGKIGGVQIWHHAWSRLGSSEEAVLHPCRRKCYGPIGDLTRSLLFNSPPPRSGIFLFSADTLCRFSDASALQAVLFSFRSRQMADGHTGRFRRCTLPYGC